MAHALGKMVVAEGVETGEQLAIMHQLGCDYIQGYHFSVPLHPAEFAAFVRGAARHPNAAIAQKRTSQYLARLRESAIEPG